MSRIGKAPVKFDNKIQVTLTPKNEIVIKGAKASLTIPMKKNVSAKIENSEIIFSATDTLDSSRALQGLYRSLAQNAVVGLTTGYTKKLELVGVGYRAAVAGKQIELTVGYSHPVKIDIPEGIEVKVDKQTQVTVTGYNREVVGQVAAKIRSWKEPEPYLGKGIKYADEHIRRKAGKSATK